MCAVVFTTVRVDAAVVQESNAQVVQHRSFMEEAQSRQIILPLQDVGVAQRWEIRGGRHRVLGLLPMEKEVQTLEHGTVLFDEDNTRAGISG